MDKVQRFDVEWAHQTVVHPAGLALLILMAVCLIAVPRRFSAWPMFIVACFIAPAQRIHIGGMDFSFLRLMIIAGAIRIFSRQEYRNLRWHLMDSLVLMISVVDVLARTARTGSASEMLSGCGEALDAVGMYLLFRCLIKSWADVDRATWAVIAASVPVAAFFILEARTGKNLFAFLGGVPYDTIIRDGRLRCQGAFAHPILAGCFWASLLPMVVAMCFRGGRMATAAIIGSLASFVVILLCASSTPVAALVFAAVGAACYFIRGHMRVLRWLIVVALIVLHLSMKAPVWSLLARIDFSGGSSTGWHRYYLIDQAINHVGEWWLIGSSLGTAHWGWGLFDVTNYYIVQGLHGGMVQLGLFLWLFAAGFGAIGRMVRNKSFSRERRYLIWSLGVALFVHSMNFLAVSYFGQITMIWYMHLAVVASLWAAAMPAMAGAPVQARIGAKSPGGTAVPANPSRRARPPRHIEPQVGSARSDTGVWRVQG